jgi:hypothetical protein
MLVLILLTTTPVRCATGQIPGAPVTSINNSGQIVGVRKNTSTSFDGFQLSEGIYTFFHAPGATSTLTGGINDFGQIGRI